MTIKTLSKKMTYAVLSLAAAGTGVARADAPKASASGSTTRCWTGIIRTTRPTATIRAASTASRSTTRSSPRDRVSYARFLHDASEVRIGKGKKTEGDGHEKPDVLRLPEVEPDTILPVVEMILK